MGYKDKITADKNTNCQFCQDEQNHEKFSRFKSQKKRLIA